MRIRLRWVAALVLLVTTGCVSERDELRYKTPQPERPAAETSEDTAPARASTAEVSSESTASPPAPIPSDAARSDLSGARGTAEVTSAIDAAARGRAAAGRAAEAQRNADDAARAAQRELEGATEALRSGDAANAAAAAAAARREAERAQEAAVAADEAAADARRASGDVLAATDRDPVGATRLRRQGSDAMSQASRSAQHAGRSAARARAAAAEAAVAERLASRFAAAREELHERLDSERASAREADATSSDAAAAVAEAIRRAAAAADEGRSGDLVEAIAAARQAGERARAAARVLQGLASAGRGGRTSVRELRDEAHGAEISDAAEALIDTLNVTVNAHDSWLSELAVIAQERLARADAAQEELVQQEAAAAADTLQVGSLPAVPSLPAERLPRPTGVTTPDLAASPRIPELGRFRQVEGGNAADWLPGGYVESSLTLRADGVLEVRRVFPGQLAIVWRAGFAWSDDKKNLLIGEDEDSRPPHRTLQGFEGGPTTASVPLPTRLSCEHQPDGRLLIDGKTYTRTD